MRSPVSSAKTQFFVSLTLPGLNLEWHHHPTDSPLAADNGLGGRGEGRGDTELNDWTNLEIK